VGVGAWAGSWEFRRPNNIGPGQIGGLSRERGTSGLTGRGFAPRPPRAKEGPERRQAAAGGQAGRLRRAHQRARHGLGGPVFRRPSFPCASPQCTSTGDRGTKPWQHAATARSAEVSHQSAKLVQERSGVVTVDIEWPCPGCPARLASAYSGITSAGNIGATRLARQTPPPDRDGQLASRRARSLAALFGQ
jgi:hypothetical protein